MPWQYSRRRVTVGTGEEGEGEGEEEGGEEVEGAAGWNGNATTNAQWALGCETTS